MSVKIIGKSFFIGKTLIGKEGTPPPYVPSYNLWEFSDQYGVTLNNVSVSYDPSINVKIDWGDGSSEYIDSDIKYIHTY